MTINSLDHAAFETTFQKYDYDMFIDYAINDISDIDEMASFELDYKNGGSKSYWSSYNNPAVTTLVHQAEAEFDTTKRRRCTRRSRRSSPRTRRSSRSTTRRTSTRPPRRSGFAVNPGGAYRLENVWLA